jgi:MSHA biogenesis protein MshK
VFKAHCNSLLTTGLLVVVTAVTSLVSLASDVDPTRPFGASSSSSSTNSQVKPDGGLILTSIIHGDGIHTAVINGNIYKMFDSIGEYRITAINSHSVILRSKSKRLKINVFNNKGFKSNIVENTVSN